MNFSEFWNRGLGYWAVVLVGSLFAVFHTLIALVPFVVGIYCLQQTLKALPVKDKRRILAFGVWFPVITATGFAWSMNVTFLLIIPILLSGLVLYRAALPKHFDGSGQLF